MVDPDDPNAAFDAGLRLLARREHSRRELARKLEGRRFTARARECALDSLEAAGYLDERRFAAMVARHRCDAAYGPVRVRAELAQHGVTGAIIEAAVASIETQDWVSSAARWMSRKHDALRLRAQLNGRRADAGSSLVDLNAEPGGGVRGVGEPGCAGPAPPLAIDDGLGSFSSDGGPPEEVCDHDQSDDHEDPWWLEARCVQLAVARGFTPDQARTAWEVVVADAAAAGESSP